MNKLNFILDKLPTPELLESISTNSTFSLCIEKPKDIENVDLKSFHKKEIYQNSFCSYSIYFNFKNDNTLNHLLIEGLKTNKNLLLQFFFHPRFEKLNNRPALFFNEHSKNNAAIDQFIKAINASCLSQGFDGIEVVYLHEKSDPAYTFSILHSFKDANHFQEIYYQLLVKELYVTRYLGVIGLQKQTFSDIINLQLKTEKKLIENYPVLYLFMKQHFNFSKQIPLLEEELKYLKSDLENQKIYLQLFKDQDEALKIDNFYYNEYEILPLWYKKIGHIIKVVTGKRTFRSLFDNNVKKYKN